MSDLTALLAGHRPELLRHCYRMMGCYADAEDVAQEALLKAWEARERFRGEGPLRHWLLTIATHACLDALSRRRRLELPQAEYPPARAGTPPEELEASRWLTPAPDSRLFPDPHQEAERRETVALAFLAALQRLPARQRAALLLKDVVGLSAEEIAAALELTVPAVNSALHRARQATQDPPAAPAPGAPTEEPPPEALREFVRSWEERDLERLTALLREDVLLAMPPHAVWFRGVADVTAFLRTPRFQSFWSPGLRVATTRANGLPAVGFYSARDAWRLHSIGVTRWSGGKLAELTVFIGPRFRTGFDLPGYAEQFAGAATS